MKRIILLAALFCGMTAFAQQESVRVPSGYQGFLEEGNCWHFTSDLSSTISLSTTHGFYFNGNMYVGIGAGWEHNAEYSMVPFYAAVRYLFTNQKAVSPVVGVRVGSYASSDGGGYADLSVGVRFASKRDFAVNMAVAVSYFDELEYDVRDWYTDAARHQVTRWTTKKVNPSGISLRIGIEW